MTENRQKTIQWLCILLYLQLASVVLSAVIRIAPVLNLSLGGSWVTWIQRCLNLATMVCLFLLPTQYRKAAIFKLSWLVCSLILIPALAALRRAGMELYLTVNSLVSLVSSVLSLVSLYLEYQAHAALSGPGASKKWNILFLCGLGLSLAGSAAVSIAQPWLTEMVQGGNSGVINWFNLAVWLPSMAVSVAYLVLLRRTVQTISNDA